MRSGHPGPHSMRPGMGSNHPGPHSTPPATCPTVRCRSYIRAKHVPPLSRRRRASTEDDPRTTSVVIRTRRERPRIIFTGLKARRERADLIPPRARRRPRVSAGHPRCAPARRRLIRPHPRSSFEPGARDPTSCSLPSAPTASDPATSPSGPMRGWRCQNSQWSDVTAK